MALAVAWVALAVDGSDAVAVLFYPPQKLLIHKKLGYMMHRIYSFLVALIVCPSVFADGLLDCGVSETLAQRRYQQIADVH